MSYPLLIDLGKPSFMVKGEVGQDMLTCLPHTSLQEQQYVKYLGVKIGHLSVREAFLGHLQEAFCRGRVVSNLGLTISEKV